MGLKNLVMLLVPQMPCVVRRTLQEKHSKRETRLAHNDCLPNAGPCETMQIARRFDCSR